jgi:hypothetical protein
MFWLLKFVLKWVVRIKILLLAVATGMAIAYGLQLREQYRSWGLVRSDQGRALPGDDLVTDPDLAETRSLVIDAPPSAVWPWLAQLGYGRGGWYSYQQLDRPWSPTGGPLGDSSDAILEEFQDLAEGDLVPTHPEGGFIARVVEPDSALVLFLDDAMTREHLEEMVAEASEEAVEAVSEMEMPPFAVSWAFLLEPVGKDRTRLVERMRVHIEDISDSQRRGVPVLKMGVFVLMRSQMLGIGQRAEQGSLAKPVGDSQDEVDGSGA